MQAEGIICTKEKDVKHYVSEECEEGTGNETKQVGSDHIIKGLAK